MKINNKSPIFPLNLNHLITSSFLFILVVTYTACISDNIYIFSVLIFFLIYRIVFFLKETNQREIILTIKYQQNHLSYKTDEC